jgi:hypothetical protein
MEQLYRDQFAHFINTTPTEESENFVLEGTGVESLALSYNPQISQFKTIIARSADAVFDGYQIQSSVSGKRIYKGDPIYEFLNNARRKAEAIETQLLEVEMANATEGNYEATKYNVLIVITEFLGDVASIGYDIYVRGNPIIGTATIADGKPTFVEKL